MSQINVNTIRSRTGGPPSLDKGAVVTGIVTATSGEFSGDVTVGGTLTYEDVTNIDSTGIVTAKGGLYVGNPVSPGIGATIDSSGNAVFAGITTVGTAITMYASSGIVSATQYFGDGSKLTGIDATAIQTGNTSVQTVDTGTDGHIKLNTEGSERVRVGQLGQIGLGGQNYGDSGQVMTSGGIGAAPTWATPSSAPEVTGISSGSITAGQPTIVNHDGTLSGVGYSYTAYALADVKSGGGQGLSAGYDAYWTTVNYDSNRNEFLYFWLSPQMSGDPCVVTIGAPNGAETSSTQTITAPGNSAAANWIESGGMNNIPYRIAWSHTSQFGVALFRIDGQGIYVRRFTSDGTTITKPAASVQVCGSGSSDWADISWDKTSDQFLVVVGKDAIDSNKCKAWVVSHSGNTLTVGTGVEVKATEGEHAILSYDPDNNKHLLCYSHLQDSEKLCGRIITVSGTTPTVGAETKGSVNNHYGISVDYLTGTGKFITQYRVNNETYARIITVSGTTVTFNTQSSKIDDVVGVSPGSRGNHGVSVSYDPRSQKAIAAYLRSTGPSDGAFKWLTIDFSTNTISNIGSLDYYRGSGSGDVNVGFSNSHMQHAFGVRQSTGATSSVYYTRTTAFKTTNINAESFLGVANASYTNGQTAIIRVSGATQDNQVGLTTGQNYFVQDDGTLGLTAAATKIYAGTAVSQTQLLVGKESVATPPGLLWVKSWKASGTSALQNYDLVIEDLDWTNVSYYLFQINGLSFNESAFSGTQPEVQLKAGSSWVTSSVYYTYADWASWNTSYSQNSQSAVAARPFVNQTAGDWTGDIYISRSNTKKTNGNGYNKYMWGRAFSNSRFSNWQCNLTASQFREEDITGIRFGNSYGYTVGYYGTIDVFKYYSGRA